MNNVQYLEQVLADSLEDFSISRSERKELKDLLATIQGNVAEQAKVRQLAFRLCTKSIGEIGELAAMDWLQSVIKLLYSKEAEIKASAFFSPGDDCLHRIKRFIREAQHSLDICVFTITDNRIVEEIIASHKRGVAIRIISDNDKSEDLGSDFDYLIDQGVNCRCDNTEAHMHHKFAISDSNKLLNGSYNWTRSAAAENNENVTVTNHKQLVRQFQQEFLRLWEHMG
ncbi:phospholipase D-like domain-containing protein [Rubritalea tangerina]|uniref:phospholipase D n=1 Tax=Rubritalea tangerina TaxID=430798 RepID=A0ABW4Z9P0_9BACT